MTPSTLSVRPDVAALFQPMRLGPYDLENRMVMAPMTRSRATDGHVPPEMAATYYRQRASAGLIVTEATQVHPEGVGYPNTPGIHSDEQVAAWRRVTEAVHEDGGRIFLQLWHVGRISHPIYHDGEKPVAPSAIRPEGSVFTSEGMKDFQEPRALTTDEVGERVAWYRRGAERALEAGADLVVISNHGVHTLDYLPHPFEVMEEIISIVRGRASVVVDSGFRRGTDVLKGLAMGADAVGLGRPIIWALAANGEDGVRELIEGMKAELVRIMTMTGIEEPAQAHRGILYKSEMV